MAKAPVFISGHNPIIVEIDESNEKLMIVKLYGTPLNERTGPDPLDQHLQLSFDEFAQIGSLLSSE